MFVNTLTADDQYSLLNRDNLTQPIATQLFQKQKDFSQFFLAVLKSTLNFEHLEKKDDLHIAILTTAPLPYLVIMLKVIESEKVCFSQMQSLISVC